MQQLESHIRYQFKDKALLKLALTHPSLAEKNNNQRLEFLGDSVLGSIVSDLLYTLFPDEPEGALARRHAALVCRETLVQMAQSIGLADHLMMSAGEKSAGGRENPGNMEDAMEALIGAMYLDGGYEAVHKFVALYWQPLARSLKEPPQDAKTALQEWAQGKSLPLPDYILLRTDGSAHEPVFTVEVHVQGQQSVQATAKSKRAAEQSAAEQLLRKLNASGRR